MDFVVKKEGKVMRIKRLSAAIAVVITTIVFTGCGGNAASNNQNQTQSQTSKSYVSEKLPASSSKSEQPNSSVSAVESSISS